jgi:hypothetical protein
MCRFTSAKSGKLYLHSDIRMLFSRKCEMETACNLAEEGAIAGKMQFTDEKSEKVTFELRSFTEMPRDPKYSPRKLQTNSCNKLNIVNNSTSVHL